MDMPWKKIAPANVDQEYLALLVYLPLRYLHTVPCFFWFTFEIQRPMVGSAGIIGYAFHAKPMQRNFWRLLAWRGKTFLMDFIIRIPHVEIMKILAPDMGPTEFTR